MTGSQPQATSMEKSPATEERGMADQPGGPPSALYAIFAPARPRPPPPKERATAAAQAQQALDASAATLRGAYTVTGYSADADLLLWLVGHSADDVQDALIAFRH